MAHSTVGNDHPGHLAGWITIGVVFVGALNWLLVGAFNFDLVAAIFGEMTTLSRAIYVIVGLAGLYLLYFASQLNREAHGFTSKRSV